MARSRIRKHCTFLCKLYLIEEFTISRLLTLQTSSTRRSKNVEGSAHTIHVKPNTKYSVSVTPFVYGQGGLLVADEEVVKFESNVGRELS